MEKYCRAGQATDDNTEQALCHVKIPKATNTHSQYVILIVFPLQQWLYERASVLHYTYSSLPALLVISCSTDTPVRVYCLNMPI